MSPALRDPRAGQESSRAPAKIALVGLRGSGKSTVGALLARELGRVFVDLDHELARLWYSTHPADSVARDPGAPAGSGAAAPSAGELLTRLGEPVFRELESRALAEVLERREPLVLACGGGTVLNEENRARLRGGAWVVWLEAPVEELARRLAGDPTPRPPLTEAGRHAGPAGAANLEELRQLRDAREAFYQDVAHLRIRTEGLPPSLVANFLRGGLGSPQA
ncbi:MAG: shikimate kinase [Planctomycetes bacterium]|nr:shikimate kinase [Planctomycetota bacterium]